MYDFGFKYKSDIKITVNYEILNNDFQQYNKYI